MGALVIILELSLSAAAAGPPRNPHLRQAIEQLRKLDEVAALRSLETARLWPGNDYAELAQVHLYTGLAHAGRSNRSESMASFRAALVLDKNLALPAFASPRIRSWWEEAGGKPTAATPAPVSAAPPPAPVADPVLPPPREQPAPLPPAPARSPRRVWAPAALAIAGVLAVAGGVVFGASASSLNGQAEQATWGDEVHALRRDAERQAFSANLLFASGAVLATGGVVVFVW